MSRPADHARRALAAAELLDLAGRPAEARELLAAEVAADRTGAADRARLLGRLGAGHGHDRPSVALAQLRLARPGAGPEDRGWLLATEASVAARVGHPDTDGLLRAAGRARAAHPTPAAAVRLTLARAARAFSAGAVPTARDLLAAVDPGHPAVRGEAVAVRVDRIEAQLALGGYDDAAVALDAAYADLPAGARPALTAASCRRLLAVGALPEADARARLALDRALGDEVRSALVAVRVEVAYRSGRPDRARALLAAAGPVGAWPDRVPHASLGGAAAGDPEPARHRELLRAVADDLGRTVRPVLLVAQYGPRLVRALLLLGDARRAVAVAGRLAEVAARTPVPLWCGLAGHAAGLVRRDPAALRAAVRALRGTAARPALADALLDLARSPRVRLPEAHAAAGEPAAGYGRVGATGDQEAAQRWDGRLDATRRRPAPRPPGRGPAALTAREAGIADLLVAGATKQQVAGRLHLSFHTVDTHVRAVYAKLGVRSRLQLARLWDARPVNAPPDASPSAAPRSSRGAG
ncbi:helix-turn-helix transcriptional regulator [Micromonospora sp. WMMC241]|uniref:helix-turn-helix domain-containing protein n=1 Tax=Micromonospora sp. WMMC241 TaxID=3015159 RepID=UPI0022B65D54|nr:helix-turn-helix transcriptional regulator [Micromonospora sp. WMMC241]MCZ7439491.1 helix-turn-helix transcriptional regulator [Micromonospora sp. WMMC241]